MRLLSKVFLVTSMLLAVAQQPVAQELRYVATEPAQKLPALELRDAADQVVPLDRWQGKLLVLNLWATWCAPCVKEMPTLLKLQQRYEGRGLQVVALTVDKGGFYQVGPFLQANGLAGLTVLSDKTSATMKGFAVKGLPTTILIDPQGMEVGRVTGEADWDGPLVTALVEKLLPKK